jgi:hypothetical protein
MHSSACFRKYSDSATGDLFESLTLKCLTASRILSVVYATEKCRKYSILDYRSIESPGIVRGFLLNPFR